MTPTNTTMIAIPRMAWRMLVLGVAAQASGSFLVAIPAFLIPILHTQGGLTLAQAGLLAAAPNAGMVLTLVAWGAAADRYGERWVIASGLALASLIAAIATVMHGNDVWLGLLFLLAGAGAASANAASGRVVVGWFPKQRRGLTMGIRQMSQPLGQAAAALIVLPLAGPGGIGAPIMVGAITTGTMALACAFGIRNPPRPAAPIVTAHHRENPYLRDSFLVRIHAVSILLVVLQFALSTFGLVWLTVGLGWPVGIAGAVIAASQLIGAVGRIAVGHLSDRVNSRVRVLRWVSVAGVVAMLALALTGFMHWGVAAGAIFIIASTISVADNGLAFTAVAEAAGTSWSGRALGIQNTGQFLGASAVGPCIGALMTVFGYPAAFALIALAPLMSCGLVPRRDQHADLG